MVPAASRDEQQRCPGTRLVPGLPWRLAVAGSLGLLVLVVDQLTKAWVRDALVAGAFPMTVIPGVIEFDFVANTGVSFGLAAGFGSAFVLLAVVVVAAAAIYLTRARLVSRWEIVGLGMLAGGAIGNAIDRALFGFVTDFIATAFIDFPVFNVADIGITVGVVIALIGFMVFSPAAHRDRDSEASSAGDVPPTPSVADSGDGADRTSGEGL